MPLIPALRLKQGDVYEFEARHLDIKFQASQGSMERSCLKYKHTTKQTNIQAESFLERTKKRRSRLEGWGRFITGMARRD